MQRGTEKEVRMIGKFDSILTEIREAHARHDEAFKDILEWVQKLHDKKSKDYGTDGDPLANIRASEEFGIRAWVGAVLRQNDKMQRIKSFVAKGILANESIEDSLIDNIVYGIIG